MQIGALVGIVPHPCPLNATVKSPCSSGHAPASVVEKVAAIERVCATYGVPLAAAALQFPLGHPQVVAVLPGLAGEAQALAASRLVSTPITSDFWNELKHAKLLREDAPTPVSDRKNTCDMGSPRSEHVV